MYVPLRHSFRLGKNGKEMFEELEAINRRPKPFEFYTASDLWTDEHTSRQMLSYHLNEEIDAASRNPAFINQSVEWIGSHFKVGVGTKIADFGCGPGLYATRLAQKQAEVTGIDFSKSSIQYGQQIAQKKGLAVQYVCQNYLDFETEDRFHLILMIMCDFCALSPIQRKELLTKFHTIMESDGFILLDVYSLTAFAQREEKAIYEANQLDGFWSSKPYYGFLNTFKYEEEKVILDKYTIIESAHTRTVYNWLQYFSLEALKREFKACGFTIETLFSDVSGSPYDPKAQEFAVVARKS